MLTGAIALIKRHSKSGEDTKYNGTVLGKGNDHGDVIIEGGDLTSIKMWQEKRIQAKAKAKELEREKLSLIQPMTMDFSRSPSSALSSLDDRTMDDEMDLS